MNNKKYIIAGLIITVIIVFIIVFVLNVGNNKVTCKISPYMDPGDPEKIEVTGVFKNNKLEYEKNIKALIDVANGHMSKILSLARAAKNIYGNDIILMAGNIANPETYKKYAEVGIDYCRCSVGTGACCLTTTQLGIHYPMASLIDDIVNVREDMKREESFRKANGFTKMYRNFPKIVAGKPGWTVNAQGTLLSVYSTWNPPAVIRIPYFAALKSLSLPLPMQAFAPDPKPRMMHPSMSKLWYDPTL